MDKRKGSVRPLVGVKMLNLPSDWSLRASAADIAIFNAFVFPEQGFPYELRGGSRKVQVTGKTLKQLFTNT